jgi:hypothetical protein
LFSPPLTNALPPGTTIYVALEPRDGFYAVASASTEGISAVNGQVVLCGRSQTWWDRQTVLLEYMLERYYVREGSGNPRGKITVQVAVPKSGRGQIKAVFLDGKPFAEGMREVQR